MLRYPGAQKIRRHTYRRLTEGWDLTPAGLLDKATWPGVRVYPVVDVCPRGDIPHHTSEIPSNNTTRVKNVSPARLASWINFGDPGTRVRY